MKIYSIPVFLLLSVLLFSCKTAEKTGEEKPLPVLDYPSEAPGDPLPSRTFPAGIDSLLNELTLDEKIGQLFVVPAYGSFTNDRDPSLLRLERLIREYHIGGIIFSQGDVYGQAVLNNKLQKISDIPLWVTQDMEFGAAMRVRGTTRFTPAMGITATGDPDNAYLSGMITAREAKALGVHQVYAPVLDVNNNPDNPVINVRSFAADPDTVSKYAIKFIQGLDTEGIVATGKHFPGHGDTDTDSHLDLPVISHDYDRLRNVELVPFQKTIEKGLNSVMTAHISYPDISNNINLPATLDPSILKRMLLEDLSFDGLVVTDGLEMSGISDHHAPDEAVVLALLAGADMMLLSPDEMTAINGVKKAVESGRITEERIDLSVKKILYQKKRSGLFENRYVDIESLSRLINTPEYQTVASRIARESVTLLRNQNDIIPVREFDFGKLLVLAVSDGDGHPSAEMFANEIRRYHSGVYYHELNEQTSPEQIQQLLDDAGHSDLVLIGSFIGVRSDRTSQIPEALTRVLREVTGMEIPAALLAFGNPYVVRDLPDTDVHLLAWASDSNQIQQTVPALFGASKIQGRFPAEIPGMYQVGDGIHMEQTAVRFDRPESVGLISDSLLNIDVIMQQAVDDSVFPGGVVGVMRKGALVWQQGYGYHDYTKTRRVQANDVYDLASITKMMATTTSVMKLVDDGRLELDTPVGNYIEEFNRGQKRQVTVRHLLLHTSGLPAFRVYVDVYKTRHEILEAVRNEPLIHTPGERYVYSDLGFMLLAQIIEKISGKRIDRFVREEIFEPLGMNSTWYNPELVGPHIYDRIPPTEIDHTYQRGVVHMKVNDERAYFMDGIAGHAGLFSCVQDMARYAHMLVSDGRYAGKSFLKPETIEQFTQYRSQAHHRGLGFDRKNPDANVITAGNYTSERTFGHLGFTGTSIWIDPEEEITIMLLTNRTFPSRRYGSKISRVREKISDAVMNSIAR